MKHIYDNTFHQRTRIETWVGVCTTVFIGFLIAYCLGGCVAKYATVPDSAKPLGHEHQAECWHKKDYKCELDKHTMEFLRVGTDSFHCKYKRCSICGQWMKK